MVTTHIFVRSLLDTPSLKKIECLCFSPHTTHLLQPLDIGVFSPLAQSYKKHLQEMTRFTTYNIDKVDYLTMVQKARKEGISSQNIESAWRATGLMPHNLTIVLKRLEAREKYNSTSICFSVTNLEQSTFIPQTPRNIDQVEWINDLVLQFCNQTLDTPKLALFLKLIKGVKLAIANRIILNTTNAELYEANIQKKRAAHGEGKQYDGQGAQHLGLEKVERRRQYAVEKQQELEARETAKKTKRDKVQLAKVCKELMRLGPDLIGLQIPKPPTPTPALKPVPISQPKIKNTPKRRKPTVQKDWVCFVGIGGEKTEENGTSRVSSCRRTIRNRRKS